MKVVVAIVLFLISCHGRVNTGLVEDGSFRLHAKNLDQWLEKTAGNNFIPSAAVRIIHKNEIVYEKLINTDRHKTYGIASISKTFAATAIMQLIEKGLVHIDDPLEKFYPGIDLAVAGVESPKITIRHLLSHTSGLPDLRYYKDPDYVEVKSGRNIFRIPRQIYPAGIHYRYSNHGYILLGGVVEKASGLSLDQYYYQNIFRPLEMNDVETKYLTGASGIKISIDDFTNYARMWVSSGVYKNISFLRQDMIAAMREEALETGKPCGLGWRVGQGEMLSFFHVGGANHIAAWIQVFPESDTAVIYLSDPPQIGNHAMYFIASLQKRLGKFAKFIADPVLLPAFPEIRQRDFAAYEGVYTNSLTGEEIRIETTDNSRLLASAKGSGEGLYFAGDNTFRSLKESLTWEFYPDDSGQMQSFANAYGYYTRTSELTQVSR